MKRIEIPIKKEETIDNNLSIFDIGNVNDFDRRKKILIGILEKYKNNDYNLSKEELIYLYDFFDVMTWVETSECSEILIRRDLYTDCATIFDCELDEVVANKDKLLANPEKYVVFIGDLYLSVIEFPSFPRLRYITGDLRCDNQTEIDGRFDSLEIIGGDVFCPKIANLKTFGNLKYIGGDTSFGSLTSDASLCNLRKIGGDAWFPKLESIDPVDGLINLEWIGDTAEFYALKSSKGFENLTYIGRDANFWNLGDIIGFKKLEYIGGMRCFPGLNDKYLKILIENTSKQEVLNKEKVLKK